MLMLFLLFRRLILEMWMGQVPTIMLFSFTRFLLLVKITIRIILRVKISILAVRNSLLFV